MKVNGEDLSMFWTKVRASLRAVFRLFIEFDWELAGRAMYDEPQEFPPDR